MKRIHVCCTRGNDAWSGGPAEPNAGGTDGPLRTLAAAQTEARRIRFGLAAPEELEVVLRGGVYGLEQTWRFDRADSGFGRAVDTHARVWPVVWRGAEGETVVISGGRRLGAWQPATLNGRPAWRAAAPWTNAGDGFFRQLWIGGARRPRARLPKRGTFRVADALDAYYQGDHHRTVRRGSRRFLFRPGDLSAAWSGVPDVDIQFRGLWISPRVRLVRVDEAASVAWVDRDTQLRLTYAPGDGLDYVVENALDSLTEPGEWALDTARRCVWYRPLENETPENAEATVGGLERLVDLCDARAIRFENLVFSHTEWRPSPTDPVSEQSSVGAPGAVRVGKGCEGIVFDRCRIEGVGGYGLECDEGATDVVFESGTIRDLGAGGVRIWHGCRRCRVTDSEIADGGHLWMSGAGVVIGRASGNAVTGCHIHDFYYTGVSVGWTWGYAESHAYGNVIEGNHIHDLGKGLLSDMGGVYLLGNAMGTRVRHNRIHDVHSLRYGGWAIYPDEGSSDLLIENNLCYRTDRDAFHQHYGRHNVVRNNIFAYGGEAVVRYSRMEDHVGLIFERNVFLARGTPVVRGVAGDRWAAHTRWAGNLYWREDGEVRFERAARALATQPFASTYLGEAERFQPLPEDGRVIRRLAAAGDGEAALDGIGEIRFSRDDRQLTVEGRFTGFASQPQPGEAPWHRTRLEVFLKPFAGCPTVAQFAAASDGARAELWHGCERPGKLCWTAEPVPVKSGWAVKLSVPLPEIADWIRRACSVSGAVPAEWRFLCGATEFPALSFEEWKACVGECGGVAADPLFVAPEQGDFRLRSGSPALAVGFVPFDVPVVSS